MKKNILTIVILAMCFVNIVLSAILIFVMIPTANKSIRLVNKVAQIIDLELESPETSMESIDVSDIETYIFEDKLTCRLANSGGKDYYAVIYLTLSLNKTHDDYSKLQPYISQYEGYIEEIVTDEFAKVTKDEVMIMKDKVRDQVLLRLHDLFQSDFILNISFGNIVTGTY